MHFTKILNGISISLLAEVLNGVDFVEGLISLWQDCWCSVFMYNPPFYCEQFGRSLLLPASPGQELKLH